VTSVTTGGAKLFVGVGSCVGLPPEAMFVTEPRKIELTVNVKLVVVFAARLPRFVQMI